jgi:hypothetical protein
MTEPNVNDLDQTEERVICPTCGTANLSGDRFCAECGTPLPVAAAEPPPSDAVLPVVAASSAGEKGESTIWLFATPPAVVIVGGLLLVLLAAALLAIGQLDHTGTIVMLSICVTPLALLTIVIGLVRLIAARTKMAGGEQQVG